MTRKEALAELIAKVEAGELPDASVWHGASAIRGHWSYVSGLNAEDRRNVCLAFNGSLDAAKALHESVMPGWSPLVGQNVHHHYWHANVQRLGDDGIVDCQGSTDQTCPARAWLLAILRALHSQETDQ